MDTCPGDITHDLYSMEELYICACVGAHACSNVLQGCLPTMPRQKDAAHPFLHQAQPQGPECPVLGMIHHHYYVSAWCTLTGIGIAIVSLLVYNGVWQSRTKLDMHNTCPYCLCRCALHDPLADLRRPRHSCAQRLSQFPVLLPRLRDPPVRCGWNR